MNRKRRPAALRFIFCRVSAVFDNDPESIGAKAGHFLVRDVAEVGVHHFPRMHGSSQFFRIRSLITTLLQLIRLRVNLWTATAKGGIIQRCMYL